MIVVTIKLTHLGEDYGTVELSTVGSPTRVLQDEEVSLTIAKWLEEVGAY